MMTNDQLEALMRVRFGAYIEDAQSILTVYDNAETDAPKAIDGVKWCRFTILHAEEQRISVGVEDYRKHGRFVAQLFAPLREGTRQIMVVADAIVAAFRDTSVDGIRYRAITINRHGVNKQKEYQVNVECRFTADHSVR